MNNINNSIWLKPSKSPFTKKEKIKLAIWLLIQNSLFRIIPHKLNFFRIKILRIFGGKIKNNCFIHPSATIYMPWNLEMDEFSSIDFDSIIYSLDKVKIGKFVSISYKSNINTGSHDISDPEFKLITKPVIINDGAFIGTEVYISPGVIIGEMTVIGARTVVTKNMPNNMICVGNPCKAIKERIKKENIDE